MLSIDLIPENPHGVLCFKKVFGTNFTEPEPLCNDMYEVHIQVVKADGPEFSIPWTPLP